MLDFPALAIGTYLRPPALGRVFYVDHSVGANTNNGVDPGTPFRTITYALTQCVANRNDYIIVLDCWDAEPDIVVVNKARVHIIGLAAGSMVPMLYPAITGNGAHAVFRLDGAHYCEIAGFSMGGGAAGQNCIEAIATNMGIWIHHCSFGEGIASQDGIVGLVGDTPNHGMIENCLFFASLTRDGISGAMTRCIIRNNIFWGMHGGIGVNLGAGVGAVIGNLFFSPLPALTDGWAITLSGATGGGLVTGNRASQTGVAIGAGWNPYRDLSPGAIGAKLNGWSDNFDGPALSAGPAVA